MILVGGFDVDIPECYYSYKAQRLIRATSSREDPTKAAALRLPLRLMGFFRRIKRVGGVYPLFFMVLSLVSLVVIQYPTSWKARSCEVTIIYDILFCFIF